MSNVEQILKQQDIDYQVHTYDHDSNTPSFAEEASVMLCVELSRVFKTLVVDSDGTLFVCVIPADKKLDMKLAAKHLGVKRVSMGAIEEIQKSTGYVIGGISPIGQKKKLQTLVDVSAKQYETIYISAGCKGKEIEISPNDLIQLIGTRYVEISK